MGFKSITLKLPTDYDEELLKKKIAAQVATRHFQYTLESKSLDARNKSRIHFLVNVGVTSPDISGDPPPPAPKLTIPYRPRKEKAVVVGSGPAGFFAALVLQRAGFLTVLIERGSEVDVRKGEIEGFERTGVFSERNNYAFGEGGAGTFSDGKLTSRSKHISAERSFIINTYIEAGAPEEIAWMAHPHLGTDNLIPMARRMRKLFTDAGGEVVFDTLMTGIDAASGRVRGVETSGGYREADLVFLAPGHSAYETFRMLMDRGVPFRTKNFAIGTRMEHFQESINRAQWGVPALPGVKAAEYRLTSQGDGVHPVYSFCMCPGGVIVPAGAYPHLNIVNGMSRYARDGAYANAACVAGLHPDHLAGRVVTAREALDVLEELEHSFFEYSGGYTAPGCGIGDFLSGREGRRGLVSSYPLGVNPAPLWELLPAPVVKALRAGLADFSRKIKDFTQGSLVGLESKTSSPVQVLRDRQGLVEGFENLYLVGEGSGYAGGIISSGADGVKAAMAAASAE